jgi:hypothetical protein
MTRNEYDNLRRTLRARVDGAHANWMQHPASAYRKHAYSYQWEAWNRSSTELFQHFCDHRTGPW